MLKIKIPYNERIVDANGITENKGVITAGLDMTVLAEENWERHFPENAKKETIFAYTERIGEQFKKNPKDQALVKSMLKALYCFLNSEDLPSFKSFVELFDVTDAVTFESQVKVLTIAFETIQNGSVAKPKN